MSVPRRIHHRSELEDVEISDEREQQLKEAFEATEYGETIRQCVAASFEIRGDLSDCQMVVSTSLHHEHIFDLVGSFASGKDVDDSTVFAAATVVDMDTREKLAAHVTKEKVLISRRSKNVSFQSFRDYVLFLESSLNVTLNPIP